MEMYFAAILDGEFINYLYLLSDPIRLKNTTNVRETIFYSYKESETLKKIHPNIEIIPKFEDLYTYIKRRQPKESLNDKN